MTAGTDSFCMPLVLRRCLVGQLEGSVTVTTPDAGVAPTTLAVKLGAVVQVTSGERERRSDERAVEYVSDVVASLAEVRAAEVSFVPELPSTDGEAPVSIPALIVASVNRVSDLTRVELWLGDMDEDLSISGDPLQVLSDAPLGPLEGYYLSQILARLDQPTSVRSLLAEWTMDPGVATRLLCALRYAGVLVPAKGRRPWLGDEDPFGMTPADAPPPPPSQPAPAASGVDMADVARVLYLVEEKLRAVENGADFYALLEVERRATVERVKGSYRELAKVFHPDRHAQLANFDADIKTRLEKVFAALTDAYTTLGNQKDRDAYDLKLAKKSQRAGVVTPQAPGAKPPGPSRPSQQQPSPKPTTTPPPPKPVETKPSAARPPVPKPLVQPLPKAAPPPPAAQQKPASPPLPKPIVPPVPRAPNPPPPSSTPQPEPPTTVRQPASRPSLGAETLFEHGIAYVESGDFERAVQAFARGVDAAPTDARMHAALGSALANLRGLDKTAETALRKAAELDPNSPDLYVELALIYSKFDRASEARTLFKRAYLLDPKNEAAIRALEKDGLLPGDAWPGFLKRLLKKK